MITIVRSVFDMMVNCLLQINAWYLPNISFCDCHICSWRYINSAWYILAITSRSDVVVMNGSLRHFESNKHQTPNFRKLESYLKTT